MVIAVEDHNGFSSRRDDARGAPVVEGVFMLALVSAPWAYGGAPEAARYGLAALLLLALAGWAVALARSGARRPGLAARAATLPALALVQAALWTSAAPVGTVQAALLLAAFLGVAVYWSERVRARRRAGPRLAAAILVAASAQAAFGVVQAAFTPGLIYGESTPVVTMPFASYVNHNHFAGLVGMAALLAAGMALGHARRAGVPTPAAVALGGLALGLAATQLASRSRGGLLALAAGLAVLVALRAAEARGRGGASRSRPVAPALALLLAGGATLALALVPAATRAHLLGTLTGASFSDTSHLYRADLAAATLRLAARHPLLGSGFGAFADAIPAEKRAHGELRATHAESDVLELAAEGGLVGLLLAVLFGVAALARLRERLAHGRDAFHNGLAMGAAAALAGLLAHSCFDFNLRLPANAFVAAALLGLASAGRAPQVRATPAQRRSTWIAWLPAAALALGASLCAWRAAGAWQLDRAARLPVPQRLGALDAVVRWHPYLAESWRARGLAWRDLAARADTRPARLLRAERDLARAVALRPRWGEAWSELAWTRLLNADVAGARDAADRSVRLDPTHVGAGVTRAQIYARSGDVAEGMSQLARTLDANPGWGAPTAVKIALAWTQEPSAFEPLVAGHAERAAALRRALESHRQP